MTDDSSNGDDGDDANGEDADSYVEPDVPTGKASGNEGGRVLTPDDLEISDSEYVEELEEDRYVVSPGGRSPNVTDSNRSDATGDDSDRAGPDAPDGREEAQRRSDSQIASPEAARTLLADELARSNARYGIDVVGRFDGHTVRHRTVSNDVVASFENLVRWYARNVTDDTPTDEVIRILLNESDFTSSSSNLADLLESHDLAESDSIADLVDAISDEARRRD